MTELFKNIESYFLACSEAEKIAGRFWYKEAGEFALALALAYNKEIWQVAGLISALSPQTEWERNKELAAQFLEHGTCGTTKNRLKKAEKCLNAENFEQVLTILNGPKTKAFAENIYSQSGPPTIDRHAISLAYNDPSKKTATKTEHESLTIAYYAVAGKYNIPVHILQAILWVRWRANK